jgi:molybdopterin synthase sulfur carrier subunit
VPTVFGRRTLFDAREREVQVRIQVKLFATLSRHRGSVAPAEPFAVDVAEGTTLERLAASLGLPCEELRMTFVNGRARPLDWVLQDSDEVGMFPPVGGG